MTANTGTRVDLNSDVGESFGAYTIGTDSILLPHVTSATVACGFHAGDPGVMRATAAPAKQHGVAVGAHPGFPDLAGFGRRETHATLREELAGAIARATAAVDRSLMLFGLPRSELSRAGERAGLRTASEVSADRPYEADGTPVRLGLDTICVHATRPARRTVPRESGMPSTARACT